MDRGGGRKSSERLLFAYALKMMTDHNGQPAVARHLQAIGLQLANPHTKPFSGPPSRH